MSAPLVSGFWRQWVQSPRPMMMLAPLANVTNTVYRTLFAEYARPDVSYTEFVSATGLCHPDARAPLVEHLAFEESHGPVLVQLFGSTPADFFRAARAVSQLGFDGVDLNFGCPDKSVSGKQGAGSALIGHPELAKDIVIATKEGVAAGCSDAGIDVLPVSVKTRIGVHNNVAEDWMRHLLEVEPASITLHGRTRDEMSKVPAHWDVIEEAARVVHDSDTRIPFFGNGDCKSLEHGLQLSKTHGVDGVMLGRASFGTPWLFDWRPQVWKLHQPESEMALAGHRLLALLRHTVLWAFAFHTHSIGAYDPVRKCYQAYAAGFTGAKRLRGKLLMTKAPREAVQLVHAWAQHLPQEDELPKDDVRPSRVDMAKAVVAPPSVRAQDPPSLLAAALVHPVSSQTVAAAAQASLDVLDTLPAFHADAPRPQRTTPPVSHPVALRAMELLE